MFPSPQVLAKPKTNISVSGSHGELAELDGGVDGEGYKVDEAVDGAAKKVRWLPTVAGAKAFTPARSPSPTTIGTSRKIFLKWEAARKIFDYGSVFLRKNKNFSYSFLGFNVGEI
ncbi:hypothetical protein FCV25MIE_20381 [Fagus crenata]